MQILVLWRTAPIETAKIHEICCQVHSQNSYFESTKQSILVASMEDAKPQRVQMAACVL